MSEHFARYLGRIVLVGSLLAGAGIVLAKEVPDRVVSENAVTDADVLTSERWIGLGVPLDATEIARFAITVFPDGRNLPQGQGSVSQGEVLYLERCASCHGFTGSEGPAARLTGDDGFFSFSDPLRILRIRQYPKLVLSVGAQWPYATSIFDYVRRAMPHFAPKSLSNNEVYAVTAYILYLNELAGASVVLNADNLPRVEMPGLSRTRLAWPEPE